MAKAAAKASIGPGHNEAPPAAQAVTDAMARDYESLATSTTALLESARTLPPTVTDKISLGKYSDMVVQMRDTVSRSKAFHKKEKEPYLRGGQAVDAFFFGLNERLEKAMAVLTQRVNTYQQALLAEERRQREEARREAERVAEEARLREERARAAASKAQRGIEANVAAKRLEEAEAHAAAPSAAIARTRFEDSQTLVTMRQVPFVEVTDYNELPLELLRPYIAQDALLRAVKAWAKITEHKQPLPGATIEMRDDTVIR